MKKYVIGIYFRFNPNDKWELEKYVFESDDYNQAESKLLEIRDDYKEKEFYKVSDIDNNSILIADLETGMPNKMIKIIANIDDIFMERVIAGEQPQDLWEELYYNDIDQGSPFDQFMRKTSINVGKIIREHFDKS